MSFEGCFFVGEGDYEISFNLCDFSLFCGFYGCLLWWNDGKMDNNWDVFLRGSD